MSSFTDISAALSSLRVRSASTSVPLTFSLASFNCTQPFSCWYHGTRYQYTGRSDPPKYRQTIRSRILLHLDLNSDAVGKCIGAPGRFTHAQRMCTVLDASLDVSMDVHLAEGDAHF